METNQDDELAERQASRHSRRDLVAPSGSSLSSSSQSRTVQQHRYNESLPRDPSHFLPSNLPSPSSTVDLPPLSTERNINATTTTRSVGLASSSKHHHRPPGIKGEANSSPPTQLSSTTTTPTSIGTGASTPTVEAMSPAPSKSLPIRRPMSTNPTSGLEFPIDHQLPPSVTASLSSTIERVGTQTSSSSPADEPAAHWDYPAVGDDKNDMMGVNYGHLPRHEPEPSSFSHQDSSSTQQQQQARHSPIPSTTTATTLHSAIKFLVSNNVAGFIIGISGRDISDLQAQSSARIKLSQSGDYYPGTQDRVCLVQGPPENVKKATTLLLTRLYVLQQQQQMEHFAWQRDQQAPPVLDPPLMAGGESFDHGQQPSFAFVVRVLVPTPSCGLIIGKAGSNIKQMVDASGVSSVRLSPQEGMDSASVATYPSHHHHHHPSSAAASASVANHPSLLAATAERVVTVTGPDLPSCVKCVLIIFDGMTSHPDRCRYANMTTSYSRIVSAAAAQQQQQQVYGSVGGGLPKTVTRTMMPGESRAAADGGVTISHGGSSSMEPSGLWDTKFLQQQQQQQAYGMDKYGSFHMSSTSQSMFLGDRGIASFPVNMPSSYASQGPISAHFPTRQGMPYPGFGAPPPPTPSVGPFTHGSPSDVSVGGGAYLPSPIRAPMLVSQATSAYLDFNPGQHLPPYPGHEQGTMMGGGDHIRSTPVSARSSATDLVSLQHQDSMRSIESLQQVGFPTEMTQVTGTRGAPAQQQPQQQQQQRSSGFTVQVTIPDSLIGSILGRGGRTLNELQAQSNTRIRISQRGDFVPGTKNRIVTIRGPSAQSVTTAQLLMNQRMVLAPTAVVVGGPPLTTSAFPIQPVHVMDNRDHPPLYRTPENASSMDSGNIVNMPLSSSGAAYEQQSSQQQQRRKGNNSQSGRGPTSRTETRK